MFTQISVAIHRHQAKMSNTGERQDGAIAELQLFRCGNAPAAEIQRVCRW